eukprot:Gb_36204 [translate_table: standard]
MPYLQELCGSMLKGKMALSMHSCKTHFAFVVQMLWLCNLVTAVTYGPDIEALVLVKNSVDSSSIGPTTCLGTWDFSVDPCDFRSTRQFVCGIRCDAKTNGKSRVTSLALDGVGYKGYLSPSIGNLTELEELDVSGNAFRGSIPESISKLSKLARLDLSANLLSGSLPLSLGNLTGLQFLSVSRNFLNGLLPASLNKLRNLMRLDLSYNNFSGTVPPLGGLIQLYNLDLSYNKLGGTLPPQLPPSLSQITLKANLLTGSLPANLGSMPGLGVLDMSCNRLSGAIDASLFAHQSLQQVNLSNNTFTGISVPNASGLGSQLVAVDIGFNKISGSLPSNFSTMENLAALSLRYNNFQGLIPKEYGVKAKSSTDNVRPFVRLYLDGNYLTGGIPPDFLSISPENITGSFANNCLTNCPSSVLLCRGAQKPASECRRAY